MFLLAGDQKKRWKKPLYLYYHDGDIDYKAGGIILLSVLLIDDEPALLEVLTPFIERSGEMRVHTAQSALEALKILPEKSFDAVVCYSVFPHFNDKQKILRKINHLLKGNRKIFICHTSSRQAINDIHRTLPEVCNHLLPKNEEMRRMLMGAGFKDISIADGKDDYLVSARKPS